MLTRRKEWSQSFPTPHCLQRWCWQDTSMENIMKWTLSGIRYLSNWLSPMRHNDVNSCMEWTPSSSSILPEACGLWSSCCSCDDVQHQQQRQGWWIHHDDWEKWSQWWTCNATETDKTLLRKGFEIFMQREPYLLMPAPITKLMNRRIAYIPCLLQRQLICVQCCWLDHFRGGQHSRDGRKIIWHRSICEVSLCKVRSSNNPSCFESCHASHILFHPHCFQEQHWVFQCTGTATNIHCHLLVLKLFVLPCWFRCRSRSSAGDSCWRCICCTCWWPSVYPPGPCLN